MAGLSAHPVWKIIQRQLCQRITMTTEWQSQLMLLSGTNKPSVSSTRKRGNKFPCKRNDFWNIAMQWNWLNTHVKMPPLQGNYTQCTQTVSEHVVNHVVCIQLFGWNVGRIGCGFPHGRSSARATCAGKQQAASMQSARNHRFPPLATNARTRLPLPTRMTPFLLPPCTDCRGGCQDVGQW